MIWAERLFTVSRKLEPPLPMFVTDSACCDCMSATVYHGSNPHCILPLDRSACWDRWSLRSERPGKRWGVPIPSPVVGAALVPAWPTPRYLSQLCLWFTVSRKLEPPLPMFVTGSACCDCMSAAVLVYHGSNPRRNCYSCITIHVGWICGKILEWDLPTPTWMRKVTRGLTVL